MESDPLIKKEKILIAEDDPQIARLVEFKLNREGFQVSIARNGKEAVDQMESDAWSLIILDIMMPILDGWEVLKRLKSSSQSQIPVLMLTAKSYQKKDIANAADLGATQFLRKPFDLSELVAVVNSLVGR